MQIKSKYKIARRLGPAIFEKTQTQKFAARMSRKGKSFEGRMMSDFGKALLEKQKARYTYLMNERQFKRYADNAIAEKVKKPEDKLFESLETRLDNVVYRLGLASTRLASKQMVSHGHIAVNGKRTDVPSFSVSIGDVISVMPSSKGKKLFANLVEKIKDTRIPNWLSFDIQKMEGKVLSIPRLSPNELAFDIFTILEFYRR
jgi:small subunit ribosomal protein S4